MTEEPDRCKLCKRRLNQDDDPLSVDCGGDCWGCVSEIEADMLDVPLDEYRADPGKFVRTGK